jgi:hypothetical protein
LSAEALTKADAIQKCICGKNLDSSSLRSSQRRSLEQAQE